MQCPFENILDLVAQDDQRTLLRLKYLIQLGRRQILGLEAWNIASGRVEPLGGHLQVCSRYCACLTTIDKERRVGRQRCVTQISENAGFGYAGC